MRRSDRSNPRKLHVPGPDLAYRTGRYTRASYDIALNRDSRLRESADARNASFTDGHGEWLQVSREVLGRLLDIDTEALPPERQKATAKAIHGALDKHPEWDALADRCASDPFMALAATASLMDSLSQSIPEMTDEAVERLERALDSVPDMPEGERRALQAALRGEYAKQAEAAQALGDESLMHVAAKLALAEAKAGVEQARSMLAGLGVGDEPPGSPKRIAAEGLLDSAEARRIAEIAGRFRLALASTQARKGLVRGNEESVGVEMGGEPARLLATELALLGDDDLELLLWSRVMEQRAVQYALASPPAGGPICFLLDESSSMSGPRTTWAKALMLGMLQRAADEGRSFAVVRFSSRVLGVHVFPDPSSPDPEVLRNVLTTFGGGGTDLGEAISETYRLLGNPVWPGGVVWEDASKADIVLITDGLADELPELPTGDARLFSVGVCTTLPGWLRDLSDDWAEVSADDVKAGTPGGVFESLA